jgi:integrase/recombinase XerC/integrase/recombinase XerD
VLERYLQYLQHVRHLSANTLRSYRRDLELYVAFLDEQNWKQEEMDSGRARCFVGYLSRRTLSSRSINRVLSAVRGYYRFLQRSGAGISNPFASIKSLKTDGKLPAFLFKEEIEELVTGQPEDFWQLRDLLILELLYSTGCRVSELASADLTDLDVKGSTLRVTGKGDKERLVFIGDAAGRRLREYLARRRALRVSRGEGRQALLINRRGSRLSVRGIQIIVERMLGRSRLNKPASPHTFRHSFATHILRQGADIRIVQELLGHATLSTTQVYTHLDMDRLRGVYRSAHPHAALHDPSRGLAPGNVRDESKGGSAGKAELSGAEPKHWVQKDE